MPTPDYFTRYDHEAMSMVTGKPSAEKVAKDIASHIAMDYDGKVRAALIGLGWHPPLDTSDDAALWQLAEDRTPSDVIESATRWKLDMVIPMMWRSAFVAGWRAAMLFKKP